MGYMHFQDIQVFQLDQLSKSKPKIMDKLIKYIIESKYNFNIDINDNVSLNRQHSQIKSQLQLYKESPIDLELPSGTLWLPYNLGVNPQKLDTPNDWYGNYYSWAETKPKEIYTEENYKFYKIGEKKILNRVFNDWKYFTKYNKDDLLYNIDLCDDPAYMNPELNYTAYEICLPNSEQAEELIENTISEYIENYNDINGLNIRKFISKINGNEILFPLGGNKINDKLEWDGIETHLMVSYIYPKMYDHLGYSIEIKKNTRMLVSTGRYVGINVRPVVMKK